jgi:hypothetical protein
VPARRPPVITFTTDFGEGDAFVASMKGVALGLCPRARLVDVTHAVEPGDLLGAAMVLDEARRWFPAGTVHVVVVDPGVGTDRRALAARVGGQSFVGPDNGVLWPVLGTDATARVHEVRSPRFRLKEVSATFHGRDLFTPAAAALAAGRRIESAGPRVTDPVRLEGYFPERRGGRIHGQVLRADRFGNLVTSVRAEDLEIEFPGVPFPTLDIRVGGRRVDETAATYGKARPGVPFALLGSGGRLEVALRDGSAAAALSAGRGAAVTVERRGHR